MNVADPTQAVTATLDGPVLAHLARAGRSMTVAEVAAGAARGSELGVRKSLARLVEQGIVSTTTIGRTTAYALNREHIAAPIALSLGDLRGELWRRLTALFSGWQHPPFRAVAFGSAARADGDESSDIDLLLVHWPLTGETPHMSSAKLHGMVEIVEAAGDLLIHQAVSPVPAKIWHGQVDELRDRVQAWTGNRAQIVDVQTRAWLNPRTMRELRAHVETDGILLHDSQRIRRKVADG